MPTLRVGRPARARTRARSAAAPRFAHAKVAPGTAASGTPAGSVLSVPRPFQVARQQMGRRPGVLAASRSGEGRREALVEPLDRDVQDSLERLGKALCLSSLFASFPAQGERQT